MTVGLIMYKNDNGVLFVFLYASFFPLLVIIYQYCYKYYICISAGVKIEGTTFS